MSQPGDVPSPEALRQQYDRLSAWSQFYHDAEIRVNTSAVGIWAISGIATLFAPKTGDKWTSIPYLVSPYRLIALIMIAVSVAAIVSTLGYWRYYEFCDIYAKKFRDEYIKDRFLDDLQCAVNRKFDETHRILSAGIFVNAHHAVWIVVQLTILGTGVLLWQV